jgi:hypothetical protein
LAPAAKLLYPPIPGSARIVPFSNAKPTHALSVLGMKGAQLHGAWLGSAVPVSEIPASRPRLFLTGQTMLLLVAGPPSAPRSTGGSSPIHSAAWRTPVARLE